MSSRRLPGWKEGEGESDLNARAGVLLVGVLLAGVRTLASKWSSVKMGEFFYLRSLRIEGFFFVCF